MIAAIDAKAKALLKARGAPTTELSMGSARRQVQLDHPELNLDKLTERRHREVLRVIAAENNLRLSDPTDRAEAMKLLRFEEYRSLLPGVEWSEVQDEPGSPEYIAAARAHLMSEEKPEPEKLSRTHFTRDGAVPMNKLPGAMVGAWWRSR